MSFPRLIATDLDGTLIGEGLDVSVRTARALERAVSVGAAVVLVTGRPVRWLPAVYEQLAGPYPAICANGAAVYDPVRDEVVESRPIAPAVLAEVCTRLRSVVPGITFATEVDGGLRLVHEPDYPLRWDADAANLIPADLAELISRPAVKLLARAPEWDPDAFTELIASATDGLVEATHSSFTGLVEMSAAGVTKGTTLASFATAIGVTAADVLAFGDMPNDIPMLVWAGRGVAVANAHPAARAAADELALSNVDEGVAVYLERLLAPAHSLD